MKKLLHGVVVSAVVGVLGIGYWTVALASSDGGGTTNELEVTGVVDAFDASSVTVDGVVYSLTDQTKVEGDLVIGGTVDIEFVENADGTFTALEVENEDEGEDDATVEEDDDEDEDEDEDGDDEDDSEDADEDHEEGGAEIDD